jgi:hypothetical protein
VTRREQGASIKRLAVSSAQTRFHLAGQPPCPRATLRSTVSALALATAALSWPIDAARADCAPTLTPTTGQTVTCSSNQPNPVTTSIVAQPGATNVTINMLSGAQLNVGGGDAVVLGGCGQVTNSSGRGRANLIRPTRSTTSGTRNE